MEDRLILEFEKPIVELQKKISDMRDFAAGANIEMAGEIESLESKVEKMRHEIYSNLTRWQKVQLARHPRQTLSIAEKQNGRTARSRPAIFVTSTRINCRQGRLFP